MDVPGSTLGPVSGGGWMAVVRPVWGRWLVVPTALILVGVVVALPAPNRTVVPTPLRSGAAALSGPDLPGLTSAWPTARPRALPAPSDGAVFVPQLVVSDTTTVGVATSPDGRQAALVAASADGQTRVLQSAAGGLFQGVVLADGRLYWMLTAPEPTGRVAVGLWSATPNGGPAVLLTSDVGLPLLPASGPGVQIIGDRLYWTATQPGGDRLAPPRGPTQLRSIPLAGGPVQVRTVPGVWTISRWPWLLTIPDTGAAPARYDLDRALATPLVVPPGYRQMTCGPAWCLASGDGGAELLRPDASDPRLLSGADTRPATGEVVLLDRYAPLLVPAGATQRLLLYDITARRSVLVAPAVTGAGSDGRHLWWSTGDHEALRWYGLDLASLR
jgi:hypothetical protein